MASTQLAGGEGLGDDVVSPGAVRVELQVVDAYRGVTPSNRAIVSP